ncbi:type II toxin-antitoxin system PemK/MazF family toxin [Paenibacillus sp. DMB5]|uniref:type II toxin-antitoxin system PemK/MazF family toxin n=1 Tax=Paenibacillus sp. DMB5 TaxID=1780103 RepID=UPI00076D31C7|nr:type II toxin-antitoxin system PemK/MazF family toxin [Paenibacillus sp. DMB5]KUP21136.1 hypothetical protein AWJ19_07995 [Paenibacillus sp. DMB5]
MWRYLKRQITSMPRILQNNIKGMIKTIVEVAPIEPAKNSNGVFNQVLQQGYIVHVKFIGLGSVINRPHFAIVWDASPKADHVLVLPMTSKVNPNYDVGRIPGLRSPNNVVKINQIQCVSRKSLDLVIRRNNTVQLSQAQMLKVREMYRISQLGEKPLHSVLFYEIGAFLPTSVPLDVSALLQRPCVYEIVNQSGITILNLMSPEEPRLKRLTLVDVGLPQRDRKALLRELLSADLSIKIAAESRVSHLAATVAATSN